MNYKKIIRFPFRDDFFSEPDKGLNDSRLIDLENYLYFLRTTDPSSFNQELIKKIRKRVKVKSDQELFTYINREHVGFWKLRPSFYYAVIDELKFRKLTAG